MSWFSSNNRSQVHRAMNRIVNSTVSVEDHMPIASDNRDDMRVRRTIPVVILPLIDTESEDEELITVGLTQDLSCEGMAIVTLGPLPVEEELAIGIADGDNFTVLLCQCVRGKDIGFGFVQSGIFLKEVLPSKDFAPLHELAKHLESNPPRSILSLISTSHFHRVPKLG